MGNTKLAVLLAACSLELASSFSTSSQLPRFLDGRTAKNLPSGLRLRRGSPSLQMNLGRREVMHKASQLMAGLLVTKAVGVGAFTVPAGARVEQAKGPEDFTAFLQGVTMEVDDLEEEAEFWIKGLGMREIRKNAKSVVVGYGSDRMVEGGGHFTFELVQAGEERKTAETQRVEIELPNIPYLISRAQEAGGTLIPRWFGTASFTDLLSPSGYTVRIFMNKDKSNIPYPIKSVSFMAEDVQKSAEALSKSLGMKPVSSFPFPFIGDGAKSLRFQDENVVLHIEKFPKDLQPPKDLRQFRLNVLAADADALAASWGAAGGKTSKDDQNLRLGGLVGQDFVIRDEKVFTAEASKSEIPPPPPPPPVKASNPSQ
uniref:VOC domain-containing protein n=1 Tax=Guillardia theta TaxID=55529 RepID=A0A7S4ULP1_GUITH|mmetsp:Transcript_9216/g.30752  ORF Transcript_9216/g.30752 Transcript_9216/m.30752 type:complete len:371 (+) Transcript_9216:281-1393(+)